VRPLPASSRVSPVDGRRGEDQRLLSRSRPQRRPDPRKNTWDVCHGPRWRSHLKHGPVFELTFTYDRFSYSSHRSTFLFLSLHLSQSRGNPIRASETSCSIPRCIRRTFTTTVDGGRAAALKSGTRFELKNYFQERVRLMVGCCSSRILRK